jgi:hypothetical protein
VLESVDACPALPKTADDGPSPPAHSVPVVPNHIGCPERVRFVVYYESIKREPKIRGIYECRCDERLQTKSKELEAIGAPSKLRFTRKAEALVMIFPTLDLSIEDKTARRKCSVETELVVYYESIKRDPKIRGKYECRCDERLQTKRKEFTHLAYTGLVLELEHLKTETRLMSERFTNAMGECEN